jgi:hypothetical protein
MLKKALIEPHDCVYKLFKWQYLACFMQYFYHQLTEPKLWLRLSKH